VKWGILSTADIAIKVTTAIIKAGDQVVAVGSRDIERARRWISEREPAVHTAKAYGTYQEVLNDHEVEAVYIPLPTTMHCEWTIKAAKHKKHVLCEKPLGRNAQEVEEMIKACKQNGVQFMDGVMWVHHPRSRLIKESLPTIGKLNRIQSKFTFGGCSADNIRVNNQLEPLGALGDLGWYNIRMTLFIMNNKLPNKVFGHSVPYQGKPDGVPFHFNAVLWYDEEGILSTFENSFDILISQWVELSGSEKVLRFDDFVLPWGASPRVFPTIPIDEQATFDIVEFPNKKTVVKAEKAIQEVQMIHDFDDMIKGKINGEEWVTAAYNAQKIIDALLVSAQKGHPIEL